jgi:hypothetical protein
VHLSAAQYVLDSLHGKPKQSVEVAPGVGVSGLSNEELETLNHLLARVIVSDGSGGSR